MQKPVSDSCPSSDRRSFLKRGIAAGALGVGVGFNLLGDSPAVLAQNEGPEEGSGSLTAGDAAMLRFAAAAEILESDFWVQYNELGESKIVKFQVGAAIPSTPRSFKFLTRIFPSISTTIPMTRSHTSHSLTLISSRKVQIQST